jgi:hypothetical protein
MRSVAPAPAATAILVAQIFLADATAQAQAQKAVFTAGEAGAYHSKFCPPIPIAMEKAGFNGYACTPSGGTPDNIARVLADPRSLGFAQLDVLARFELDNREAARKIVVVRTLACEGLWLIGRNKDMATTRFGQIAGNARRLRFAVADGGSRASFEYLQKIDPDGLGRARNIDIVKDGTAAIETVGWNGADVGFFVQFVEPSNPNIRLLDQKKLHAMPVVNGPLVAAKVADLPVYHVQTFALSEGSSIASGNRLTTTCTPAVLITGAPEAIADPGEARDHRALIEKIKAASDTAFLPTYERWARMISGRRHVTPAALKEMLGAYETAKKKAEAAAP